MILFLNVRGGTRELSKIFFDKISVKEISELQNTHFVDIVNDIQRNYSKSKAIAIDTMIFDLYELTNKEHQIIGFIEIE